MEVVKRCKVALACLGLLAGIPDAAFSQVQNPMDPSLTELGYIPLPDLGFGTYTRDGYTEIGGLYPGGWCTRPPELEARALEIARDQIQPLDADGNPDPEHGKIVMMSAGMSNTVIAFEGHAGDDYDCFRERAERDPARNRQLVVVNGAQGTRAAMDWAPVDSTTYTTMKKNLAKYGVTAAQVQVVWVFHALRETGPFPTYAQELQGYLEATARNLKVHFPNVKLAYYTSRERAYLMRRKGEPDCYEAGFAIRWMIERQMNGAPQLNWDPEQGEVVAPLILWGPYFWCDGLRERSDGLIWTCCEPTSDVYNNPHPEASGAQKCADQVYAFFKTDPTATPWYLRHNVTDLPPQVTACADVNEGDAPLTVHFSAEASDADGAITEYVWTFGDGTFSYNPNGAPGGEPFYLNPSPVKIFHNPGVYTAYLTVTDNDGNATVATVQVTVTGQPPMPTTTGDSPPESPGRSR
ncbi:MAG: PKD domain-containing protein [Sedimentisphaerales bacterium]|nr:PKD domain-containing protein [Sedimentisphaerales bacterium]